MTTTDAIKFLSRYVGNEYYTPKCQNAHLMAIEALIKMNWVSVKDRLPSKSGLYLVYTKKGNISVMDYSANYKQFNVFDNGVGRPILCTHWMFRPEPPEEEID